MANPSEQAMVQLNRLLENTNRRTELDPQNGTTVHHLLDGSSETWIRDDKEIFKSGSNDRNVYLEKKWKGTAYRVVKEVKKRALPDDREFFLREVTSMIACTQKTLDKYFVQLECWFESSHSYYIAMEYCPFGDLERYFTKPPKESWTKTIIWQVLKGLKILHSMHIAHRDLKPRNILIASLPDGSPSSPLWVKIADFGISKRAGPNDRTKQRSCRGTEYFMAPEVKLVGNRGTYTEKCDIWSLGCIQYWLFTHDTPDYQALILDSDAGAREAVFVSLAKNFGASRSGIDFMSLALEQDPKKRPTAAEALEMPWLAHVGMRPADSDHPVQTDPWGNRASLSQNPASYFTSAVQYDEPEELEESTFDYKAIRETLPGSFPEPRINDSAAHKFKRRWLDKQARKESILEEGPIHACPPLNAGGPVLQETTQEAFTFTFPLLNKETQQKAFYADPKNCGSENDPVLKRTQEPDIKPEFLHKKARKDSNDEEPIRSKVPHHDGPVIEKFSGNLQPQLNTGFNKFYTGRSPASQGVDAVDRDGRTALWRAAGFKGWDEEVERQIEAGANIRTKDASGLTPLHAAAMNGAYESVAILLKCGKLAPKDFAEYINEQTNSRDTPLLLAVKQDHIHVVTTLLNYALKDLDLSIRDEEGKTALMVAVERDSEQIFYALTQIKGSSTIAMDVDDAGHCVLWTALRLRAESSKEWIRRLWTVMADGARSPEPDIVTGAEIHLYRLLVKITSEKDGHDSLGRDFKLLFNSIQYSLQLQDTQQADRFYAAICHNILKMTMAREAQNVSVLKELVEVGRNFVLEAMSIACSKGYANLVSKLYEWKRVAINDPLNSNDETALIMASKEGQFEVVQDLLTRRALNVEAKDHNGYTALIWAARNGQEKVVEKLLTDTTAQAHVAEGGSTGFSALHCAVLSGNGAVVRNILEKRPEERGIINQPDKNQRTILAFACENNLRASVITELINGGADTSIPNNRGFTPLALSIHNDNLENVKAIVAADPESIRLACSVGRDRHTPLWLAVLNLEKRDDIHDGRDGSVVVALLKAAAKLERPDLINESTHAIRRLRRDDSEWGKLYSNVTKEKRQLIKKLIDVIFGVSDQASQANSGGENFRQYPSTSHAEGNWVSPLVTYDNSPHSTEFPPFNAWERSELEPGVSDRRQDRDYKAYPGATKSYYGANHPQYFSPGYRPAGAGAGMARSESPKRRRRKQYYMPQGPPQGYHNRPQRYPNASGYNDVLPSSYESQQVHPPSLTIPVPRRHQRGGAPQYLNSIPFEQVPRTMGSSSDRFLSPESAHSNHGDHLEPTRPRSSEGYHQKDYRGSQYRNPNGNVSRSKSHNDRSRPRASAGHWERREPYYGEQLNPDFVGHYSQQQAQAPHPQPPNAPLIGTQYPGHFAR